MTKAQIDLQEISASDLETANAIVTAAIETWDMPPRLRRLVAGTHQYEAGDFQTMRLFLLQMETGETAGLLAVEDYPGAEADCSGRVLLLHGLYVHPDHQRQGIGRAAVAAAKQLASENGFAGILIKAHASANAFFESLGLSRLPVRDETADYPHRFWWPVDEPQTGA